MPFLIVSGGLSALIPTLDLELSNSEVLLLDLVVFPLTSTPTSAVSVNCFPVQLVLQSSYCVPNPFLPVSGLNTQLSFWPSRFVVTSGRFSWVNQVSEDGVNDTCPRKFTILNGLIVIN